MLGRLIEETQAASTACANDACVHTAVCVCVCVCEREKDKDRPTQRGEQRERQKKTDTAVHW